jgi:aminoglycoside N3'-acetyltransferase
MRSSAYTKEDLVVHLKSIGINQGDTVLVRASLGRVGRMASPGKKTFMAALQTVVGPDGTLVSLAFTRSFIFGIGAKKPHNIFTKETPPSIGALANMFLNHPDHKRSKHPTNSFIAIGKNAQDIVSNHNENSLSYTPISRLIELNAKMLLVGCIKDSPGFTTVHYAQEVLGITRKSFFSYLLWVYYKNADKNKLFIRKDCGGCSAGFRKFYADYLEESKLSIGMVGDAQSMLINSVDAYNIEYERIKKNHKYFLCDNNLCVVCRVSWLFNMQDIPKYLIYKSINLIKSLVKL